MEYYKKRLVSKRYIRKATSAKVVQGTSNKLSYFTFQRKICTDILFLDSTFYAGGL
jgi:hypothetical protein